MKTRHFSKYYKHILNGIRVKRPRKKSSISITGIVFSRGVRIRNGLTHTCPTLRVYAGGRLISSHPLKSLTAETALHSAVKSRFAQEKRTYKQKDADKQFIAWISKKDVKTFLSKNNIPIYTKELTQKK